MNLPQQFQPNGMENFVQQCFCYAQILRISITRLILFFTLYNEIRTDSSRPSLLRTTFSLLVLIKK